MLTRAEIAVSELPKGSKFDSEAILAENGKRLRVSMISSVDAKFSSISVEQPPEEFDAPNPGARMLVFEAKAPRNGRSRFPCCSNRCPMRRLSTNRRPMMPWRSCNSCVGRWRRFGEGRRGKGVGGLNGTGSLPVNRYDFPWQKTLTLRVTDGATSSRFISTKARDPPRSRNAS